MCRLCSTFPAPTDPALGGASGSDSAQMPPLSPPCPGATRCHSEPLLDSAWWPRRARLAALVARIPLAPWGIPRCWISGNGTPCLLCVEAFPPFCRICIADGFCYARDKLPLPRDNSRSQSLHSLPLPIRSSFWGCLCASSVLSPHLGAGSVVCLQRGTADT